MPFRSHHLWKAALALLVAAGWWAASQASGETPTSATTPNSKDAAASTKPSDKFSPEQIEFYEVKIRPLLIQNCYKCHSAGAETLQGGLRLDSREGLLHGGDSGDPAVVPGDVEHGVLLKAVRHDDSVSEMPPKRKLTDGEIADLTAWVRSGAAFPPNSADVSSAERLNWWSLRPLASPPLPALKDVPSATAAAMNPIDVFIHARLTAAGLKPAPPADRRTLVRRIYFDLIGLPPTPEEVEAFVADADPQAYEHLVDRLLASPRYGEHWARYWMDMAHFAETHGHDQDRIREHAWPYRDYLIESFNADKPYARFIQEQVAGDALFPDDPSATVALGFLAAGPWDESSLRDIREDSLDRKIARYLDRDDIVATVMNNVTSTTVQCARCHDHKFDPISQADYYALQAVFAGVERGDASFDADPALQAKRRALQQRQKALQHPDAAVLASLDAADIQAQVAAWEAQLGTSRGRWTVLEPSAMTSAGGATLSPLPDHSILSAGPRPERDVYTIAAKIPTARVTAIRLEVMTDDSLPQHGPGRQDNGNLHLSEFQAYLGDASGKPLAVATATADFNQEGWDITRAIDGNEQTAWGIYPKVGHAHTAVFVLKEPLDVAAASSLTVVLKQQHGGGHIIGRLRLAVSDAAGPAEIKPLPDDVAAILDVPRERRAEEQRRALSLYQQRDTVEQALAALPAPSQVYAMLTGLEPRVVQLLQRGEILKPRETATPGALGCVRDLKSRFDLSPTGGEAARRAALAQWLTDRQNPLTWRSIVNRVWQQHFGRGLVTTANDFGRMGAAPSHPELLDWLAAHFRDDGQSLKALHRLIVTSATYRQTARLAELDQEMVRAAASQDADNALLWHANRRRLDAECYRDAVLAISGRLDLRMGGPSDRQFDLKPGIHVTPRIDYSQFDLDSKAGQRRSIYRFLFRTLPDPLMEALDCPAGDQITPLRTNSVTVQQALALWNGALVSRYCEHLAARLEHDSPNLAGRVELAVRLAFGRSPSADESRELSEFAEKDGLANLCRLLLNSNEFLFVN